MNSIGFFPTSYKHQQGFQPVSRWYRCYSIVYIAWDVILRVVKTTNICETKSIYTKLAPQNFSNIDMFVRTSRPKPVVIICHLRCNYLLMSKMAAVKTCADYA